MPGVSSLLTGGVSVGILAGVVSGLCYLLVAGLRWAGRRRSWAEEVVACGRCQNAWLLRVTCADCGQRHCKDCSLWDPQLADYRCAACHALREVKLQSSEWFYSQVQQRFRPAAITQGNQNSSNGVAMESDSIQVRDFVEKIVENLVAGDLDNVCVKKLYAHPEYERMFSTYHQFLCETLIRLSFTLQMAISNKSLPEEESPSAAHSALKTIIKKIVQEAMNLPALHVQENGHVNSVDHKTAYEDINSKTYEDILATAILNKVIERYQKCKRDLSIDGNSNILNDSYPAKRHMDQHTKYISSLEIGVRNADISEEALMKDYNLSEYNGGYSETPLAYTIEEQIEEITMYNDDSEEDEVLGHKSKQSLLRKRVPFPELGMDIIEDDVNGSQDMVPSSPNPTDLLSPIDSWEENWLFQKRRIKIGGAVNPMPVAMLVPNPSEDFRALIGDRDAEEISDLSECSDGALEDLVLADTESPISVSSEIFKVNAEQKYPCGQIDSMTNNVEKDISEIESVPDLSCNLQEQDTENKEYSAKEDINPNLCLNSATETDAAVLKSSLECESELSQKDSEYTEDYAVVIQTKMDSLNSSCEQEENKTDERLSTNADEDLSLPGEEKPVPGNKMLNTDDDDDFAKPPRPGTHNDDQNGMHSYTGTIAEREHKKWESAPPLPNNPYSPENISKRLNQRVSSVVQTVRANSTKEIGEPTDQTVSQNIKTPLQVNCASTDLDFTRYSRDYYINGGKSSSDPKQPVPAARTSVKITKSSPLEESKMNPSTIERKVLKDANEQEGEKLEQINVEDDLPTPGIVENKIALWQREINQTEQQLIRKFHLEKKAENNLPKSPIELQNQSSERNSKPVSRANSFKKSGNVPSSNVNGVKSNTHITKTESSSSEDNLKLIKGPLNDKPLLNGKHSDLNKNGHAEITEESDSSQVNENVKKLNHSEVASTISESSLGSSDSELNQTSLLPSVKQLAKQFSGSAESDTSSQSSSPIQVWKQREREQKAANVMPKILPHPRRNLLSGDKTQIHSLTARSISKEFREVLKRNMPPKLDRNVYSQVSSDSSQPQSAEMNHFNHDTTPGYTSDESGTASPTPEYEVRRNLRSSIQFWENMQRTNK